MSANWRTPPTRRRWLMPMVAAFLSIGAGLGCSGDETTPSGSTPATITPGTTTLPSAPNTSGATATTSPTGPPPSPITVPPSSGSVIPATAPATSAATSLSPADIDAISAVFQVFFGGNTTTVDEKVAVLQDGETYREMLTDASANEQFQQMSIDIRGMRLGSDDECRGLGVGSGCAVVTHDVLIAGFPMAAGIDSPAMRAGDAWLVGARAWCNLVEIGGETCPTAPTGSAP